jgi:hypothetical protein
MVAEITTGDDSKRADGCKRPRLGPTQGVLAVSMAYELAFHAARQLEMAREHFARVSVPRGYLAVPLWPTDVVARIAAVLVGVRLTGIARAAT